MEQSSNIPCIEFFYSEAKQIKSVEFAQILSNIYAPLIFQKMCVFQKALEDLSSRMSGAEAIHSGWQSPTDASEAVDMLDQLQKFGDRLGPIQRNIEEANDQASLFASSSVIVSHALLAKLEDLNTR